MTHEEHFMQRALDLARLGMGKVSPNPLVGCVIVLNDKIIGEGWHDIYGGPHAEVNAVSSVADKTSLSEATVYVNLEPCAHHGKTPPCADMLINHKVKKVVIANIDPFEKVAGKGIDKLRSAGIEVVTGILNEKGHELNKRFFTFVNIKRPYIILKWAETLDGFIARENYDSKWISNASSRQLVHRWRSEEDAILIGTNTALHDNPKLNVREWSGRNPIRIVIDRHLRLNSDLKLFDGSQLTLCYNTVRSGESKNLFFIKLSERDFISGVINDLFNRSIQSVIVEGGTKTLEAFIAGNTWDEARVFRSSKTFELGIAAPSLKGKLITEQKIESDTLSVYYNSTKI
ncbi:MAG: bifunctional diaminohydroxyphosphoribosylaminopyrimidine deaminase/5-amino-6-(5-phosphoribosylamino)uracil reductase RibD [Cyclobacteriaceae bacterium]|nr:bifunctional diaminohydroxyphosphoribosylaminopyrimidine deaminase/5-amino-6-(5-phosphoribosylamino)uracil reductase RibD [Cyclobacteriaceae bacterium]